MTLEASSSSGVKLLDEFTIRLDEEENDTGIHEQTTLVGKVLSDRSLNKGAVKYILCKAWGDPDNLEVTDFGMNQYMFIFKTEEEAMAVLIKGPWYVMNKLVSLQRWTSQAIIQEMNFFQVQFWIQLHGLPLENINTQSAEKILNQMGEIIEVENPVVDGFLLRHFIRARVRINIKNPLSTGCWVPRRNLPKIWISIKYEKLQDMCFKCGIIGHEQRSCKEEKEMSTRDKDIPRYSLKVSAPPAKELSLILEERKRWKKNAKGEQGSTKNDSTIERHQEE